LGKRVIMEKVRAFIGVPLAGNVSAELDRAALLIKEQDAKQAIRWVADQNLHLTLAFLGDQSRDDLERLSCELDSSLETVSAFSVQVETVSGFPVRRPHVVAAMITENTNLTRLQRRVMNGALKLGLAVDTKPFQGHITVGRIKKPVEIPPQTVGKSLLIGEVALYTSELTPDGPVYGVYHKVRLNA
jgi:2'-5' RNA ligase